MNVELHSYFVNQGRETIEVEFTVIEDDVETTKNLEILIEDLEEVCDLFEELNWYDDDGDDCEVQVINRTINSTALAEGLHTYLNQNTELLK